MNTKQWDPERAKYLDPENICQDDFEWVTHTGQYADEDKNTVKERALQLDDRVQITGAWPRNAKGKVRVLIGGSKPLVRVDFDRSHSIGGNAYSYNWYRPEQIQRIAAQEGSAK